MWQSQNPGFKLPDSLADKTPPSAAAEWAAGLGLSVFLVGMVGLLLLFHSIHLLNGYLLGVAIIVPGAAAGLLVRYLVSPDALSEAQAMDRPVPAPKAISWILRRP